MFTNYFIIIRPEKFFKTFEKIQISKVAPPSKFWWLQEKTPDGRINGARLIGQLLKNLKTQS
jgi:hypothetical protein